MIPWSGKPKCHIREYYKDAQGKYKAGYRGVTFNPDCLENIIYGLALMREEMLRDGIPLTGARHLEDEPEGSTEVPVKIVVQEPRPKKQGNRPHGRKR